MQLRHLTTENQKQLRTKNIICIEHSDSYLKELQARFPDIYNSITCIVDDYKRNQGEVNIQDRQVSVEDTSYLNDIDYNQSSILITSDYYLEAFDKLRNIPEVVANNQSIYFFANKETEYELTYREQYKSDSLRNLVTSVVVRMHLPM